MSNFRDRLKMLRGAAGLKQEALAAAIGMSQSSLSKLENGQVEMTLDLLRRLQKALGVGPFAIVGGTEWGHLDPGGDLVTVHGRGGVQWLAYFASALTNLEESARQTLFADAASVRAVCEELRTFLYEPVHYTDPVGNPDLAPAAVYSIDRHQVGISDVVIVYCEYPSFGAGQEIEIATAAGVPVVLLVREGRTVSRMVLGSHARNRVVLYRDTPHLQAELRRSLQELFDELALKRPLADSGVGRRIREIRAARSASADTVARLAGISEEALLELERGDCTAQNPSLSGLRRIAQVLSTTLAFLVEGIAPSPEHLDDVLARSKGSLEDYAISDGLTFERTQELWSDYISQYEGSRRAVAEARTAALTVDDWRRRAIAGNSPKQSTMFGDD
jgi:transcriptional regulator with XRE-family HTH domain